jgi:hypothetical protein
VLPPVVTGAVVMLIGFNLAPVVANIYWPQDQWVALLTMLFTIVVAVAFKGFIGRISVFLALIFGTALVVDPRQDRRPDHQVLGGATEATEHVRWNTSGVGSASWLGLPRQDDDRGGRQGGGRLAHAELLHGRDPARPARRHRAHRGEHRARQGRRRDDRQGPRPDDGTRYRR